MERKTFRKGDVIIEKGAHETCAYIIESEKVEVSDLVSNRKAVLAVLGEKQIFGEMGLVEDQPRTATGTAIEDIQLAVLNRDSFNELFEKKPKALLPIIKALFERLRTANKMLISKDTLGEVIVVDRESYLGTIVNGKRIDAQSVLNMGEIK
ncbi:MAG: cyclic nucleotide-binding domain-containing protein [Candidatus Brocadiales bacterium]|nr:cyclic nucleotide-binding domain-containing protein [Candidatus Brocadiales bacterium]